MPLEAKFFLTSLILWGMFYLIKDDYIPQHRRNIKHKLVIIGMGLSSFSTVVSMILIVWMI